MKKIYFVLVLFCAVSLFQEPVFAQDDWQLWNGYSLKKKIAKDFSFKVSGEQRITDDFSQSTLANVSPGFLWHPSEYFETGPFFKYERSRLSNGDHIDERRWLWEATLKTTLGGFKISDRNRIAYRDLSTSDEWRYRNMVKVAYPISVKSLTIAPFISEEIFWQWNDGSFNQNRVQLGFDTKVTQHVSLGIYYMIKSNRKGADWDEAHILGTSLGLSF